MVLPEATGGTTKYTLTVVNGTGSGSYASGTTVDITANAAQSGQQFLNWTGATVANANAAATSLSMPAANTTVTSNYVAVAVNIPYPVTTHPRLWINQTDLPRLQSWAVSSNPIYAQGVAPLIQQCVTAYQTNFFPGGVASSPFADPGDTQGYGASSARRTSRRMSRTTPLYLPLVR